MDLRIAISPDDSEGVVLSKVMKAAKEIRSDDKKRGAAPAGCRAALWSAGGCFCCRMMGGCWPFWVPGRQGGRAAAGAGGAVGGVQGGGAMVCRGWLGGGDPAAICGGNLEIFNQPLTIFLVVAMVWWLAVFFLCFYCLFRRALPGR